jgi:hypothetical protein
MQKLLPAPAAERKYPAEQNAGGVSAMSAKGFTTDVTMLRIAVTNQLPEKKTKHQL